MIEENGQSENYGYEVPNVLYDSNWRKSFEDESQNKPIILEGIIKIRKYLSQESEVEHLIKVILSTEIHKPLFKYAKRLLQKITSGSKNEDDVICLYELVWIFTNLCSGSKQTTSEILQLGIVNFCKELFNLEQLGSIISILFQLIGNLAGESSLSLKINFLSDPKFYSFMKNSYSNYIGQQNFHTNATWSFSNLFRNFDECEDKKYIDNLEDIILAYYPIIDDLLKIDIEEAMVNLLQIFNYLSRNQNFYMRQTFQIIEKYLTDPRDKIFKLVVQIMGNYISNCDEAVDYALNSPVFLEIIFKLLSPNEKIPYRKQAAWILSNIFAGNVNQIQKIFSIPTIFNRLYEVLISQQNQRVLKQLIWTVSNSFSTCPEKCFEIVFQSSIIEPLSFRLSKCKEKISFQVYVSALLHYLKKFQKNPNLHFETFLKNIPSIETVLAHIECNYHEESMINKVFKIREKIQELIQRGPITEEEMAKHHLQNFKI